MVCNDRKYCNSCNSKIGQRIRLQTCPSSSIETASSIAQWYSAGFECGRSQVQSPVKDRLLDSLVVECWLRVWEVPGSIPSQGPRHTKDFLNMVPVVPLFIQKGKYWLFLKNEDKKIKLWITSGIENPSKSEVIGRCGG